MAAALPRGSTAWLLAHELRLAWRAITGRKGGKRALLVVGAALLVAAATAGPPVGRFLLHYEPRLDAHLVATLDGALAVIFTMILSQTLSLATLALFERGDLELLLSSPLPPGRILAARAVAIAATPFAWFAALASLAVLPLAAVGQTRWLAVYPVLAAVALLAASAGIGLSLLLFRLLGARRTREAGQILATLIGAGFFLLIQLRAFAPGVFAPVDAWSRAGAFDPAGALAWPARAVLGAPLPLLSVVAVALLVFAGAAAGLGRRFSTDVAAAAGASAAPARTSRGAVTARGFGGGLFAAILRKELRLLLRDPTLISQVLLRSLYVVPLTLAMLRTAPAQGYGVHGQAMVEHARLASLAGSVTFMAGQIAGSLAWICISAEDAPDLLAVAPVPRRLIRRAKLAAALIPVALLLAAPIAALTFASPWIGLCAAFGAAAAAATSTALNQWLEKPLARRAFRGRRDGSAITAIAEIVAGLTWAMAAWVAAMMGVWVG